MGGGVNVGLIDIVRYEQDLNEMMNGLVQWVFEKSPFHTEGTVSGNTLIKVGACLVYLKSNKEAYLAREEWVCLIQSAS